MMMFTGLAHCVREAEPLAPHCWLRLGGPARFFAEPTTLDELVQLVQECHEHELAPRVLGDGSNVLIPDQGVDCLVIRLAAPAFGEISVVDTTLTAGGGAQLSHAMLSAAREGLGGLDGLAGIPGTVGAALHGNSGDQSSFAGRRFKQATVLTRQGEIFTRDCEMVQFGYMSSTLDELAILSVDFELEEDDRDELTRRMQKKWIYKRQREPSCERRVARLFADPLHVTATEIIEQAGLKGFTYGGAMLYERDANFVVASDTAKSDDVRGLIDAVRQTVSEKMGVDLKCSMDLW